ncbi:hypothetical protein [Calothrix parietina]|uniref:hypothetical protein n=1 Tax=Calothrix parietina TaxID=32054 RepID=UPI0030D954F3
MGVAGLMNHQTDDKLITGAFVIKASDDDGLIHQPHCQDFIDSAHNKKFFLLRNGKDDRIQSDVTAIALSGQIIGIRPILMALTWVSTELTLKILTL